MTHFAPPTSRVDRDVTFVESFAAHILGDVGSSYNFSMLPDKALLDTPWASNPAGFWNGTDHWEYTFLDSAPSTQSGTQFLAIYSDRVVKSNATCTTPPYNITHDGLLMTIHLSGDNRKVAFPALAFGLESIYYLTTPIPNDKPSEGSCGPGCSSVKVLEPQVGPLAEGSTFKGSNATFFYDCNITVSAAARDVPPVKAAQAAQAIALSGQQHPEFQGTDEELTQYVGYNFGVPFGEPQNNSASDMASLISRFAIGVISAAAQTNPRTFVPGSSPAQGVRLQFESLMGFNVVLIVTGILQLVLVVVTAIIVSRVTIPEEILLSRQDSIRERFVLPS